MRLSILRSFWQLHKCRAHILRSLEGFVTRWRAQGRGGADWDEPLAIGFLITLVTRLAQRFAGPLDPDALGSLQGELWARFTGLPPEPLGERLVLLSAGQDPRFVEGCRRALIFAAALEADIVAPEVDLGDTDIPTSQAPGRQDLADLWDSLLAENSTI